MELMQPGQRISVVGSTGSGKTTTARHLARILDLPCIELDALYWDKNWTGVPEDVFQARVAEAAQGESWIIDGNYSRVRPLIWHRADTVVYLNYSFGRVLWQLLGRTLRRSFIGEELWSGNRESLWRSFFSQESILWWMLTTYFRRRRQYARLMQQPEYAHLRVIQLTTPSQTTAWLVGLEDKMTGADLF
jgi:adenylate kinase family enzyme